MKRLCQLGVRKNLGENCPAFSTTNASQLFPSSTGNSVAARASFARLKAQKLERRTSLQSGGDDEALLTDSIDVFLPPGRGRGSAFGGLLFFAAAIFQYVEFDC